MHSKQRYKIFIYSIILRQLESFPNYMSFSIIFPKILDAIQGFTKLGIFSDSSLHRIFESERFMVPFATKNNLTWGVKCEKLNFRNS